MSNTHVVYFTVLCRGVTIEHLCRHIHKSLISEFNYALVWGTSTRHSPQRCGLKHELHDQDVVQVVKRTVAQQKANGAEYAKMAQEAFDKYKEKKKKSMFCHKIVFTLPISNT